jgi:hypothetical protein
MNFKINGRRRKACYEDKKMNNKNPIKVKIGNKLFTFQEIKKLTGHPIATIYGWYRRGSIVETLEKTFRANGLIE